MAFFFQAEDGIRDKLVTGVQTCALPIFASTGPVLLGTTRKAEDPTPVIGSGEHRYQRSEERRVGKECRTHRSPRHDKKKVAQPNLLVSRMQWVMTVHD